MNEQCLKLRRIATRLSDANITVSESLQDALDGLETPQYKIAIVGRFQSGKSHLINEAFLNQNLLLKEGVGLCTTAVTTEIAFGETPRLTVEYKGEEATKIVDDPSAFDIHAAVAANDDAGRVALAAKVKSVRLEWPCAALKNISLYDTAGIDDPNPELLRTTTYRTIPNCDAAVLVVGAKALSVVELDFIRNGIFSHGLGRVMVLVSYRHDSDALSEEGREKILEAIRGQLSNIGKADVPVKMVCYDPVVTGDVLNNPADIRAAICAFAESASLTNRVEKAKIELRKVLSAQIRKLELALNFADKDSSELSDFRERLLEIADELRMERDVLWRSFGASAEAIREDAVLAFRAECGEIIDRYIEGFEKCDNFAEAQKRIEEAASALTPQFDAAAIQAFEIIRTRISEEVAKCGSRLDELLGETDLSVLPSRAEISVDGGLVANLKPLIVTLGDYVLTMLLLPGGLFMSWCLRFLWGHLPIVGSFVPSGLLKDHMIAKSEESLRKSVDQFCVNFGKCADEALSQLREKVFKLVSDEIEANLRDAITTVEAASSTYEENQAYAEVDRSRLEMCRKLMKEI